MDVQPSVAERLAGLRARIAALRPFMEYAGTVSSLEAEVAGLLAEEWAARPLSRRLQSATDALKSREEQASQARESAVAAGQALEDAKAAAEAAHTLAAHAEAELLTARQTLQQVKAEVPAGDAPRQAAGAAVLPATLDALEAACRGAGSGAAALVQQLREVLGGSGAVGAGVAAAASVATGVVAPTAVPGHADGPGAAMGNGAASVQQEAGAAGPHLASAAPEPTGQAPAGVVPVRPSGRRGRSADQADDSASDAESVRRSRSRERREQEQTQQDIRTGRQRTLPFMPARGRG